jgi:hypothetical protein
MVCIKGCLKTKELKESCKASCGQQINQSKERMKKEEIFESKL